QTYTKLISHQRDIGSKAFTEKLYRGASTAYEAVNQIYEDDLTKLARRTENTALWNYDWATLIKEHRTPPIFHMFLMDDAWTVQWQPYRHIDSLLEKELKPKVTPANIELGKRPERIRIVGTDWALSN